MTDTAEVVCEFSFFDTHREGASLVQLEKAIYAAVKTAPKGDQGGRLIESIVFTPEKCRALGLKADAIPSGRVWIGLLKPEVAAADHAVGRTEMKRNCQTATSLSKEALDGCETLIRHGMEKSPLFNVFYKIHRHRVSHGAEQVEKLPADDVVDTTLPIADRESRRRSFYRKLDRRVAELCAGPNPLSRLEAEEVAMRDKNLVDEYRALFV